MPRTSVIDCVTENDCCTNLQVKTRLEITIRDSFFDVVLIHGVQIQFFTWRLCRYGIIDEDIASLRRTST